MAVKFRAAWGLAVFAWVAGCATGPRPLVDSGYAARAYTPGRIAVLPPDVFVVLDQVGDNDPVKSARVGQALAGEAVGAIQRTLRERGYDVATLPTWGDVPGPDGTPLLSGAVLEGLARGVISFASSPDGGREGATELPPRVSPELANRIGWATQSDAVLYVNVKGVVTTPGRQTATILTAVFIVVIVAAIVLVLASQKGGGAPHGVSGGSHAASSGGWRAAPLGGSAVHPAAFHPGAVRAPPIGAAPVRTWRGGGRPPVGRGGPLYVGGGLNLVIPIDQPVYTHDGSVTYDDPIFAGDELYVSMTLVSTYDGRVLWHARDSLDLEANRPADVDRMVRLFLTTLPPALPPPPMIAPAPAP